MFFERQRVAPDEEPVAALVSLVVDSRDRLVPKRTRIVVSGESRDARINSFFCEWLENRLARSPFAHDERLKPTRPILAHRSHRTIIRIRIAFEC